MASTAVTRVALQFSIPDSTSALRFSSSTALGRHFSPPKQKSRRSVQFSCHLSLNGCGGGPEPVDICETRVLAPVSTLEAAIPRLCSAIAVLNRDPPSTSSGIIRLEVPVRERTEAIGWLQQQDAAMARCFFSERKQRPEWGDVVLNGDERKKPVSLAGVGSAVYFRRLHSFSFDDWRCIKRFLSKDCPLIRAYGAIRFDAGRSISSEWKDFGAFYFIIPQVEFNELEKSSTLSTNIAWDDNLLYPWGKAIEKLQLTMSQICSVSPRLRKDFPTTSIISSSHTPNCTSWVASVKKAMEIINRRNSEFVKVPVVVRVTTTMPIAFGEFAPATVTRIYQDGQIIGVEINATLRENTQSVPPVVPETLKKKTRGSKKAKKAKAKAALQEGGMAEMSSSLPVPRKKKGGSLSRIPSLQEIDKATFDEMSMQKTYTQWQAENKRSAERKQSPPTSTSFSIASCKGSANQQQPKKTKNRKRVLNKRRQEILRQSLPLKEEVTMTMGDVYRAVGITVRKGFVEDQHVTLPASVLAGMSILNKEDSSECRVITSMPVKQKARKMEQ